MTSVIGRLLCRPTSMRLVAKLVTVPTANPGRVGSNPDLAV